MYLGTATLGRKRRDVSENAEAGAVRWYRRIVAHLAVLERRADFQDVRFARVHHRRVSGVTTH